MLLLLTRRQERRAQEGRDRTSGLGPAPRGRERRVDDGVKVSDEMTETRLVGEADAVRSVGMSTRRASARTSGPSQLDLKPESM